MLDSYALNNIEAKARDFAGFLDNVLEHHRDLTDDEKRAVTGARRSLQGIADWASGLFLDAQIEDTQNHLEDLIARREATHD